VEHSELDMNEAYVTSKDANRIQQHFSSDKKPTLWRALPAIERLQTAWESKASDPKYNLYRDALSDGLKKLKKYYTCFDEKPAYVLSLGGCFCFSDNVCDTHHVFSVAPVLQAELHQDGVGG